MTDYIYNGSMKKSIVFTINMFVRTCSNTWYTYGKNYLAFIYSTFLQRSFRFILCKKNIYRLILIWWHRNISFYTYNRYQYRLLLLYMLFVNGPYDYWSLPAQLSFLYITFIIINTLAHDTVQIHYNLVMV